MENVQAKLKAKLDEFTIEGRNKRLLFEHFGESNLKRLNIPSIALKNGFNPTDGTHYREIFLLSGKVQEFCDIAGYTQEPNITTADLKNLETEIFRILEEREK